MAKLASLWMLRFPPRSPARPGLHGERSRIVTSHAEAVRKRGRGVVW